MPKRGDPKPDSKWKQPTVGDACSAYQTLVLKCLDCNPQGVKIYAEEFASFYKLPYKMTLWALAQMPPGQTDECPQRLVCSSCGSKSVELETEQPHPHGHRYRMARKGFNVR
jgi:hypothetical protein